MTVFLLAGTLEDSHQIDLIGVVGLPLPPGVSFVEGPAGPEGLPAFYLTHGANVGRYARDIMPKQFFTDFTIVVNVRPDDPKGGVIFAIMEPRQTSVILGLQIETLPNSDQAYIIFMYGIPYYRYEEFLDFPVPNFIGDWQRFTLSVKGQEVTLYFGCDNVITRTLQRKIGPLFIPENSPIYLGRKGLMRNADDTSYRVSDTIAVMFPL